MNKSESKYFNTAIRMDKAFLELLNTKDFEYITVKEICEKAGVNRSTFYLHYENIGELLDESIKYINRKFDSYFLAENKFDFKNIANIDMVELYLITPQYLIPYLKFIKENKKLYKISIDKSDILGAENVFNKIFKNVINPIMERYQVPVEKRVFTINYYLNGIIGIIKTWLNNDCKNSIEFISEIIMECIKTPQN